MSLVIIVNLFQCSGLKATVCPSTHTEKKKKKEKKEEVNLEGLEHGNTTFSALRKGCFVFWGGAVSQGLTGLCACFACYININLMGTWGQHCHLVTRTKHFSILLSQFHTHSHHAQKTDLAWQNCKKPLLHNAILYWLKAHSGCSPLNKRKNKESKMRSIPVPKAAMNSSATGCAAITTSFILDSPSYF